MKTVVLIFLFVSIVNNLLGQNNEVSSVIAPSPNASMLAKFANIPVDHYSGLPQIKVPLYVLKGRDLQLDINLSYHAQGVKVDQYSGPTGMNWALNSGGVITRVVRDLPDEIGYSGLNYQHGKYTENPDYDALDKFSRYRDGEPDIFYYNFFGRSGMFFIDADGDCYTMPYQKLKITPAIGVKGIGHWEIIDENGNKYIFGQGNSTETTSTNLYVKRSLDGNEYLDDSANEDFISAWYINKAKSPISSDSITFSYLKGSSTTTQLISQKSYYVKTSSCLTGGNGENNYISQSRLETTIVDPVYISSIENQVGKVQFFYDNERIDLPGAKRMTSIIIKNFNNDIVESYWLEYYYYIGQYDGIANTNPCSDPECHRLFLKKIFRGNNKEVKYREFGYLERLGNIVLPTYNSFMVDHWGFYNYPDNGIGQNYGNIYTKLPENGVNGSKADKAFSSAGKIGTLNKIYYETGGFTEFEYTFSAGGNKIDVIINFKSNNERISRNSYTYNFTEGKTPKYVSEFLSVEFQSIPLIPWPFNQVFQLGCETEQIVTSSESLNALYDLDGIYLGASKIIESFEDQSSIEYYYTNFSNQPDEEPSNYILVPSHGTFSQIIKPLDANGQPFTSYTHKGWERGLLDRKVVKNSTGQQKIEVDNIYNFDAGDVIKIKGIKSMNTGVLNSKAILNIGEYYLISRPYYLQEVKTTENETVNKLSSIKYEYNPNNLLIQNEIIYDGNELIIKKYKYAIDYASYVDADLNTLNENNILTAVVENQIWKADLDYSNPKILGGTVTSYDLFGEFVLPSISYSLKISEPLSESLFGENLNSQGPFSALKPNNKYTQDAAYRYDDLTGNLVQVIGNDEVPVSYVYGYNNSYPVAKVTGALHEDVMGYISGYTGDGNLSSSQINNLKNNIPNAHISTYTYDPLYGMTSETGPDNIKLTYEYDDFGRLKLVKDHNGDILKRYTYQYRVQ